MPDKEHLVITSRAVSLSAARGMVWRLGLVAWLAGQSWAAFAAYSFAPRGQEGFDVLVNGAVVAPIRLAANGALLANEVTTNDTTIRLSGLHTKNTNAVVFASDDYVSLTLPSGGSAPEPVVRFQLTFQSFHSDEWAGMFPSGQPAPFHFLACAMPAARVWHQRGWLNATPLDDRFPLLIDPHGGTPEIACSWNRNWGYICPLGGHPIPMIGLWDPVAALYVGYDFQELEGEHGAIRARCLHGLLLGVGDVVQFRGPGLP